LIDFAWIYLIRLRLPPALTLVGKRGATRSRIANGIISGFVARIHWLLLMLE
jgi:hypothetical protein